MDNRDYDKWQRRRALGEMLPDKAWPLKLIIYFPGTILKLVVVAALVFGGLFLVVTVKNFFNPPPAAPSYPATTFPDPVGTPGWSPGSEPPAIAAPAAIPTAYVPPAPDFVEMNELGRVLADCDVRDETGAVIDHLHAGRTTHILGRKGAQIKIRKNDGTEGFVPADRVADVRSWFSP